MSKTPAQVYGSLGTGPALISQYEPNRALPIDGTNQSLRNPVTGSPFTVYLVPPSTLVNALSGGGISRPRSVFDPLLEEANQIAVAGNQNPIGTRVPASSNVGIIDSALKSNSNWSAVKNRQTNFKTKKFVSTPTGQPTNQNLVAQNGTSFNDRTAYNSNANQVAIADVQQALSVLSQLRAIRNTPRLTLFVNPEEFSRVFTKKVSYSERNRNGYLLQSNFDEQVTLSGRGRTGNFITGVPTGVSGPNGQNPTTSGVQYASKLDSAAWQNLMNLYQIYKNNGVIYNPDGSEAHLWTGLVAIEYDQFVYYGQFDSFNYNYDESSPNAIAFDFSFTVSFMTDVAENSPVLPMQSPTPSPSDPRYIGQNPSNVPFSTNTRSNQVTTGAASQIGQDATFDPFVTNE